jgi:arylsulfatase A-like enzyme
MGDRIKSFAALLILVAALSGCEAAYIAGLLQRPNIVLITVSSLRHDRLFGENATKNLAPNIQGLASDGVVFTQAFTPASWSVPAVASILTGLYPRRHGVATSRLESGGYLRQDVLNRQIPTLAVHLARARYASFGYVTDGRLASLFGFDKGFNRYSCRPFGDRRNVKAGFDAIKPALQYRHESERPYLLWLHYTDPTCPYFPETPWINGIRPDWQSDVNALAHEVVPVSIGKGRLPGDESLLGLIRDLYDSEVAALDSALGKVFEQLPGFEDSIIVLVADHGEAFGEQGSMLHGTDLYNETVRVPLIVRLPNGKNGGMKITRPVSLVDLMPTLLDLVDAPIPADLDGVSLVSLMEGKEVEPRTVMGRIRGKKPWQMAVGHGYKLLCGKKNVCRLYDLEKDAAEQTDLSEAKSPITITLQEAIRDYALIKPMYPIISERQKLDFATVARMQASGVDRGMLVQVNR